MTRSTRSIISLGLALASVTAAARTPPAEQRFLQGQSAYNLGHFEEALAAYSDAYKLQPLPELLYDMAQCHRQLGRPSQAAFFYRRYLALSPHAPKNAPMIRRLIDEMDAQQAAAEAAAAKAAAEVPAPATPTPVPAAALPSALTAAPPTATREPGGSVLTRWWFWGGIAAAVGAGVAAAYAVEAPQGPSAGTLGTVDTRRH